MTAPLATDRTVRRDADGSIDYGFYRAEAQRLRHEHCRAAWQWLSGAARNAASRCRQGLSLDREIDIVTRLR
jgi:hypothetical protein